MAASAARSPLLFLPLDAFLMEEAFLVEEASLEEVFSVEEALLEEVFLVEGVLSVVAIPGGAVLLDEGARKGLPDVVVSGFSAEAPPLAKGWSACCLAGHSCQGCRSSTGCPLSQASRKSYKASGRAISSAQGRVEGAGWVGSALSVARKPAVSHIRHHPEPTKDRAHARDDLLSRRQREAQNHANDRGTTEPNGVLWRKAQSGQEPCGQPPEEEEAGGRGSTERSGGKEAAGAGAVGAQGVAGVGQGAVVEGEAAAADAVREAVPQLLQL